MDNLNLFSEYFFVRLLINTISMVILIRIIYYAIYNVKDLFFVFFLINFIVFLLALLLEQTKVFNSLGSAFGLLAAFSLLRFRTESLSAKDMTYLFIIMAIGLINSIMKGSYLEIVLLNLLIIFAVYAVDGNLFMRNQKSKIIEITGAENIRPENQPKLMADLRQQTGLDVQKIFIEHIDLGRNKITVKVYYF